MPRTKSVECCGCGAKFKMQSTFLGSILCENCDWFMRKRRGRMVQIELKGTQWRMTFDFLDAKKRMA